MRDIDEIWITNSAGITLLNISKERNIDPYLFTGFISILNTQFKNMMHDKLTGLFLESTKIIIYHGRKGIKIISRSRLKVNNKSIINKLKMVERKFFEHFEEKLKDWNGNISIFDRFGRIIKEIFEDTPEKRCKNSLW